MSKESYLKYSVLRPPSLFYGPPITVLRPHHCFMPLPQSLFYAPPPSLFYAPPSLFYAPPITVLCPPNHCFTPPSLFYAPHHCFTPPQSLFYAPPPITVLRPSPNHCFTPPNHCFTPPITVLCPPITVLRPPITVLYPPSLFYAPLITSTKSDNCYWYACFSGITIMITIAKVTLSTDRSSGNLMQHLHQLTANTKEQIRCRLCNRSVWKDPYHHLMWTNYIGLS